MLGVPWRAEHIDRLLIRMCGVELSGETKRTSNISSSASGVNTLHHYGNLAHPVK